jgi:phosphoglycerol transferase MdoB-like AlkP superfamily enzyme
MLKTPSENILSRHPLLTPIILLLICAYWELCAFYNLVELFGGQITHITLRLWLIPEAMLICLPAALLGRRWRYTTPALLALSALFHYANILYFRNFNTLLSVSILTLTNTIDNTIMRSALASVRWFDIILFTPVLLSFLSVFLFSDRFPKATSRKLKLTAIAATLLTFTATQAKLYIGFIKSTSDLRGISIANIRDFYSYKTSLLSAVNTVGLTPAYTSDAYRAINMRLRSAPISDTSISEIANWSADGKNVPQTSSDTISGKRPNLIFIVVESLNTKAVEFSYNGRYVMPTLHSLIADTATISFTSVYPQAGNGRSSDGQMMYYSGIYPSNGLPMCVVSPEGPYPSLARTVYGSALSHEFIAEKPGLWNHSITSKAFGFGSLHHTLADDTPNDEADTKLFDVISKMLPKLKAPFFAAITTMSMHDPYILTQIADKSSWIADIDIDDRDKAYFLTCANFDKALTNFIASLKSSGIWDNSLIVIASDHEARRHFLSREMSDDRLMFAMINSGRKGFSCNDIVGQIDIYPTVLDALGQWDSTTWHGFGTSLLRNIPGFALRLDTSVATRPTTSSIATTDSDTSADHPVSADHHDSAVCPGLSVRPDSLQIARQRRALALSQEWISATNKSALLNTLIPSHQ